MTKKITDEQCKDARVRVYFEVPTGGDWSGMDIEISSGNTIKVEVETRTVKVTKKDYSKKG